MANALFDNAKESLLGGEYNLASDSILLILVDEADDIPDPAADSVLADIDAAARVHTSASGLANATITGGVFDADDLTLSSVTGDEAESIVLYNDTHASDELLLYIDTATGLPVTPNGADITVQWDSGANKIFAL